MLPERTSQVKFEVSPDAADVIRRRGGQLWIWPSPDRSAYATTEPPGERHEWTTYRQAGFAVHVDDAIVAPQRWVVTLPKDGGRHLDASRNAEDPGGAFARLPVVDPQKEEPTDTTPRYQRVSGALAILGTVVWVLGIVGFHHWWLEYAREGTALLVALLVLLVRWVWRRVRGVDAAAP